MTAGIARVLSGLVVAVVASWWRPVRVAGDALSEVISAVPATLIAVLIVIVFIRGDAQIPIFIVALLVTGWAGPYRVARAELGLGSGLRISVASLPIIEYIFQWNGIGYIALQAIASRDPAALTASALVLVTLFALLSFVADLGRPRFAYR